MSSDGLLGTSVRPIARRINFQTPQLPTPPTGLEYCWSLRLPTILLVRTTKLRDMDFKEPEYEWRKAGVCRTIFRQNSPTLTNNRKIIESPPILWSLWRFFDMTSIAPDYVNDIYCNVLAQNTRSPVSSRSTQTTLLSILDIIYPSPIITSGRCGDIADVIKFITLLQALPLSFTAFSESAVSFGAFFFEALRPRRSYTTLLLILIHWQCPNFSGETFSQFSLNRSNLHRRIPWAHWQSRT